MQFRYQYINSLYRMQTFLTFLTVNLYLENNFTALWINPFAFIIFLNM